MMRILRLAGALILCLALWRGYVALKPEAPTHTPTRAALVAQAAREVAPWFEQLKLEQAKTFFGNLDRDEFGHVTLPLRQSLVNLDRVNLVARDWKERLRGEVGWTLPTCRGSDLLLGQARELGCEYAIGGRVQRFSQLDQKVELLFELEVWDVAEQKLIDRKTIRVSNQPERTDDRERTSS